MIKKRQRNQTTSPRGNAKGAPSVRMLTQKQQTYVSGVLETGSKVEAYRRAYACSKMNPRTIQRKAIALGQLPHVKAKIQELQARATDDAVASRERTLKEIAKIAYAPMSDDVKCRDKLVALGFLSRHFGLFQVDNLTAGNALRDFIRQIDGSSRGLPSERDD